jgi:hypothetical protein
MVYKFLFSVGISLGVISQYAAAMDKLQGKTLVYRLTCKTYNKCYKSNKTEVKLLNAIEHGEINAIRSFLHNEAICKDLRYEGCIIAMYAAMYEWPNDEIEKILFDSPVVKARLKDSDEIGLTYLFVQAITYEDEALAHEILDDPLLVRRITSEGMNLAEKAADLNGFDDLVAKINQYLPHAPEQE